MAQESSGSAALEAAGSLPIACRMLARSAEKKQVFTNLVLFVEHMCSGSIPSRVRALVDGGMGALLVAAQKKHGVSVACALGRMGLDSEGKLR